MSLGCKLQFELDVESDSRTYTCQPTGVKVLTSRRMYRVVSCKGRRAKGNFGGSVKCRR